MNLQSGINIGSWRLRDNSTWSYNSGSSNSSDSNKWQHINTSAERDIIPLRSRLTVGDSYTDGDIFDSVNFRGLKINSTEAMLPDSQHGFAPVIHGIARGTAQVSVKQNGYDVYQTTVPPGPFTIDDINSAANGGDLQVTIKEADGSIQTLYVPYSSVPVLQRAGYTRYALAMGEYRSGNNLQSSPKFVQASLMHGLKGNWTPYGGMQIAEDYQAFNLGIGKDLGLLVPFLSISRRPIRRLQMTPVTADNRLNPSTANPSTRREPISRSQDIAILRKVFITYPTVHTVE